MASPNVSYLLVQPNITMTSTRSSSGDLRIIIVGGGIAGLSAVSCHGLFVMGASSPEAVVLTIRRSQAIALRGPGRQITVLERSRMLHETGALISLQPNASKIVTQWGLDPALRRIAAPQVDSAFRLYSAEGDGALVREIALDTSMFGADRKLYHRRDLHAALREAATGTGTGTGRQHVGPGGGGPPADVRTGAEVVDCDAVAGRVTLREGEVLEADMVVGADGIKSVLRNTVVGGDRKWKAQPSGLSAYRMLIPTARLPRHEIPDGVLRLQDPAATTMVVGRDRRVIMGPGRAGQLLGVVAMVPDETVESGTSSDDSWTRPGSKKEVLAAFRGFPSWLRAIFDQAPEEEVGLWQLRDIDRLPTWTKGRVILIGDAAHAMLPTQGQGASQAIEDAEALQAFLAEARLEPENGAGRAAQHRVEEVMGKVLEARYERASLIQAYSRDQARPGTAAKAVTLDPGEFMRYNCEYHGAAEWLQRQRRGLPKTHAREEEVRRGEARPVEGVRCS